MYRVLGANGLNGMNVITEPPMLVEPPIIFPVLSFREISENEVPLKIFRQKVSDGWVNTVCPVALSVGIEELSVKLGFSILTLQLLDVTFPLTIQ